MNNMTHILSLEDKGGLHYTFYLTKEQSEKFEKMAKTKKLHYPYISYEIYSLNKIDDELLKTFFE